MAVNENNQNNNGGNGGDDSRADELFDILNEFRREQPKQSVNPEDNADGTNDLGDDEKQIPAALIGHLSDEGGEHISESGAELNPHFTESFTAVPEGEDNADDEEDGDEDDESEKKIHGVFRGLALIPKTVIYIVIVLVISAYLSYYFITAGNDVFALITDSREVVVTIPEGATDNDVAEILKEKGLIEYSWLYTLFMDYRSDGEETEYIAGDHTLNTDMNYMEIITSLTVKRLTRTEVRVTIPEGYTVDQIIDLFVSVGLGEKDAFVEAINNYPYKHEFVRLLDEMGYSSDRKYRLEGYLYPDTYDFYSDSEEYLVINKLLNTFNSKFWNDFTAENSHGESYKSMCEEDYGLNFDDIVVLASMIQGEGKTAVDFEYISYVFHNRLSHPDSFPLLESDATIQYVLSERITDSTEIDITYNSPYNTYIHEGLPPGAICSPGLDSLLAAIFPSPPLSSSDKEINAYFFVSNNAGKTYYASSLGSHQRNVAQAKADNEALESGDYEG